MENREMQEEMFRAMFRLKQLNMGGMRMKKTGGIPVSLSQKQDWKSGMSAGEFFGIIRTGLLSVWAWKICCSF